MRTALLTLCVALAVCLAESFVPSPSYARDGMDCDSSGCRPISRPGWDCDSSGCRRVGKKSSRYYNKPRGADCDSSGCAYPGVQRAWRGPDGRLYDCDSSGCRPLTY